MTRYTYCVLCIASKPDNSHAVFYIVVDAMSEAEAVGHGHIALSDEFPKADGWSYHNVKAGEPICRSEYRIFNPEGPVQ